MSDDELPISPDDAVKVASGERDEAVRVGEYTLQDRADGCVRMSLPLAVREQLDEIPNSTESVYLPEKNILVFDLDP